MKMYVCGFDSVGTFLCANIYDQTDEDAKINSLARPKKLNRAVVITEVVEQSTFDLYRKGYYRNANGVPEKPELQFSVGQVFEGSVPQEVYVWCDRYGCLVEEIECGAGCVRRFEIVAIPEPSAEELQAQALADAKRERASEVERLTVEVEGMVFDADEVSQQRVARSIVALQEGETMPWVLYDNTIVQVNKSQLMQVLRLAGQKQCELWVKPYTG